MDAIVLMPRLIVLLLFFGSGVAALIYEVVWQQLLQLVIGSSTVSIGVLLAMFMGGMCLGSLWAPRLMSPRWSTLRAYAVLEGAIGIMALGLLAVMPVVTWAYQSLGGGGAVGIVARALVAAVCLLPPTCAMGATLPVIARGVARSADGRTWLGFFYAGNLAGAVVGCLAAGFFLLRAFDANVATYVAAGINGVVAVVAWIVGRPGSVLETGIRERDTRVEGLSSRRRPATPGRGVRSRVYVAIAGSGFCALAAEVVWTRFLALSFGATVYTFSIILAVFLVGLGLGSAAGASLGRRSIRSEALLGCCQLGAVGALVWSARVLANHLPYWPDASLEPSIWTTFAIDLGRATYAVLPASIFWGASFTVALSAVGDHDGDAGETVGRVYGANTLGAIGGALVTSLVLIPMLGSQHAQQAIGAVALTSALWMLAPLAVGHGSRAALAGVSIAALAVLALVVPPLPGLLVAYGRHSSAWTAYANSITYVGEGMHASVAVSRGENGVLSYHNAGKVQASSEPADMRLQRMLGHLTTLIPATPKRVLVIGCGAGVTAGAVSVNPAVEQVTIVDIEPLVPQVARTYFGRVNHDVLKNPKVRVIADDARHFLQTTGETFDAITSDPLDPWVKGAAALYTREFFDLARRRLRPGGVMTLYVQLFESSTAAVKSEIATFFQAFPDGLVFGNTFEGRAIDTVLVGTVGPPEIWVDELEVALRSPGFSPVDSSLIQAGLYGAVELFGNYAGRARDLGGWLADAQITRDRDLRLQYLAGLGLNQHSGDDIYREMLAYRVYPDDVFVASESTIVRLKAAMEGTRE